VLWLTHDLVYMYRYAVVTGANKGIGMEIVKQLASLGVVVVLTARNETRGKDAITKLHQIGLSNVMFHQLDVLDALSIESLAKFIQHKFGRLDILVSFIDLTSKIFNHHFDVKLRLNKITCYKYNFIKP
jgi:NADP-dependent 3-hydroxy acid dehydrogenase YdfG